MLFFLFKLFVTAFLIVIISEIAKRSDAWGGLVAALPVSTFLVILWMHLEGASDEKISHHMSYTLLYVLPTLPVFLVFPTLISRFGFWVAVSLGIVITALCIFAFNWILNKFGMGIL